MLGINCAQSQLLHGNTVDTSITDNENGEETIEEEKTGIVGLDSGENMPHTSADTNSPPTGVNLSNRLETSSDIPSNVILKRKCNSLALISSLYDSSDSDSDSKTPVESFQKHQIRTFSSSSEQLDSDNAEDSDSDLELLIARKPTFIPKPVRVKGEFTIKDLPPIEDLHISVKQEDCIPFGKVYSIVDTLLVIQSLPDKPALNMDSVFFRHNGLPIGRIFDVFGPVKRPFYSVRFNTNKEIHEKGLSVGAILYAAPETKHANYVFTHELMKTKGSDASWVNDCEPPPECIDYSDDEEERNNKRNLKKGVIPKQEVVEDDTTARKKYLTFEKQMNRNNVMRNEHFDMRPNSSPCPPSRDVGWHHNTCSAPPPLPHSSTQYCTSRPFHIRPPLFIPPRTTRPPPVNVATTSQHLFIQKPPFSFPNQSSLPYFNPLRPPPGWPPRPQIISTTRQTFSTNSSLHFATSIQRFPFLSRASTTSYFTT